MGRTAENAYMACARLERRSRNGRPRHRCGARWNRNGRRTDDPSLDQSRARQTSASSVL